MAHNIAFTQYFWEYRFFIIIWCTCCCLFKFKFYRQFTNRTCLLIFKCCLTVKLLLPLTLVSQILQNKISPYVGKTFSTNSVKYFLEQRTFAFLYKLNTKRHKKQQIITRAYTMDNRELNILFLKNNCIQIIKL